MQRLNTPILLNIFLVIAVIVIPINGLDSRNLDETTVPGSADQGTKCTPSCTQSSPPPPLPSPPPPSPPPPTPCPPPPSPPALPPPTPKKSPTQYCPPPPPPSFIYITGPPGNLYPVDQDFGGASQNFHVGLPVLLSFGMVALLALL